jgi:hypothetical protein
MFSLPNLLSSWPILDRPRNLVAKDRFVLQSECFKDGFGSFQRLGIVALGGQDAVSDIINLKLEPHMPRSLPRLNSEIIGD